MMRVERQAGADLLVARRSKPSRSKFSESQGARRQVRRDRLEPHHQRREFLPAEVRAPGAGHEQYRSPSHRRSWSTLLDALSGKTDALATTQRSVQAKAVLVVGRRSGAGASVPRLPDSRQLPASSGAHLRGHAGTGARRQVRCRQRSRAAGGELAGVESLRDKLKAEADLVIVFGDAIKGDALRKLVDFGDSLGIPVKYVCLVDYSNSRGAVDMGLIAARLLPGYEPSASRMHWTKCSTRIWTCCGWSARIRLKSAALASQDGFRRGAGPVPDRDRAAGRCRSARRFGLRKERHRDQRQRRSAAAEAGRQDHGHQDGSGNHGLIAKEMGVAAASGPGCPTRCSRRFARPCAATTCRCRCSRPAARRRPCRSTAACRVEIRPDLVQSDHERLFTSGTLGRYSKVLNSVMESRLSR